MAIRFVDPESKIIREEFLDFISAQRITGEALSTAILSRLAAWSIDISKCRGQGYDGASNMSSSRVGVQGTIADISPLAFYMHCQSHQLNLCIVKACSIPHIRNTSLVLSEISKFSPKREHFLLMLLKQRDKLKKHKLKDVCRTRWIVRIDAYLSFHDLYTFNMEEITTNSERFGIRSWDTETITKANGFLSKIMKFDFLVSFFITMTVLSSLRGVTVKLQKTSTDILKAYEQVSEVQLELELLKVNCEEEFHLLFEKVCTFAETLDIPVSVTRIVARQTHRSNIPSDTPVGHYRRNVFIHFLDHVLVEMRERFATTHQHQVKLLGLLPSTVITCESNAIEEIGQIYSSDLPGSPVLNAEFLRLKRKWENITCRSQAIFTTTCIASM